MHEPSQGRGGVCVMSCALAAVNRTTSVVLHIVQAVLHVVLHVHVAARLPDPMPV